MRMLRNLVLVELEKKTSEIVMPESVEEQVAQRATTGVAIAVGPECETVKVGDLVHYKSYVGNQLKDETLGNGTYIVVSELDIMACRTTQK